MRNIVAAGDDYGTPAHRLLQMRRIAEGTLEALQAQKEREAAENEGRADA